MLKLYIGNKNYSSWSMRPWVLLKQAGIVFEEVRVRFDSFDAQSEFKRTIGAVSPTAKVPVLVDGGIRRGTDVLKAMALGASAVLVGRPAVHGLAHAGAAGVAHVLRLLRDELEVAMALTGCKTLADAPAALSAD